MFDKLLIFHVILEDEKGSNERAENKLCQIEVEANLESGGHLVRHIHSLVGHTALAIIGEGLDPIAREHTTKKQ